MPPILTISLAFIIKMCCLAYDPNCHLHLSQPLHFKKKYLSLFVLPRLQVLVCSSQRVLHVFVLSQSASVLQPGPAVVLVLVGQRELRLRVSQLGQPVQHLFGFALYLIAQLLHKTVNDPQMLGSQPGLLLGLSESRGEVILAWIHVAWGGSRRRRIYSTAQPHR